MSITIEYLYPEYNNLYGDRGNLLYLKRKLRDAGVAVNWVETGLFDEPAFVNQKVDFLYIGPCTERQQEQEIAHLAPYRDALAARMNAPTLTLATGNAIELFGTYIQRADRSRLDALGLTPLHAERFLRLRYNELCLGMYDGMEIVGFKNQLSHSYGENPHPFLTMQTGTGTHPAVREEGYHTAGFFATYLIGPLLPLNPPFAEALIRRMLPDYTDTPLPYEREAYRRRVAQFRDPSVNTRFH